jgi:hypothetical protein
VRGDEACRVLAVLDHEVVPTRRDDVRPVFEVHLAVLEQVVQEREDSALDALDPIEEEDFALFRCADGSAVGVLEDSARSDLATLFELGFADISVEDADLERFVQEVKERERESARERSGRGEQKHILVCVYPGVSIPRDQGQRGSGHPTHAIPTFS